MDNDLDSKIEVIIPHFYLTLTQDHSNRAAQFKRYVRGYIRNNFPYLTLVKIEGMKAICEKKE